MKRIILEFISPNGQIENISSHHVPRIGDQINISGRTWEVVRITWTYAMTQATIEVRDPETMR